METTTTTPRSGRDNAAQTPAEPPAQSGRRAAAAAADPGSAAPGPATLPPPRAEQPKPTGLLASALEYVEDRHWEITLGTSSWHRGGAWMCSCGNIQCGAPGAHPVQRDWQKRISGQPSKAHEWWNAYPDASILLPTGRSFDVLEVSEAAGCMALARLERIGTNVGPVAALPTRRMCFFVLPNARLKAAKLLGSLGWGRIPLDLVCRGAGDYVVAPPSRMGGHGHAQWVRPPGESVRWLPDVEEVLAPLAYACGLHR